MKIILLILGMALITFALRATLFLGAKHLQFSSTLQEILNFVPVAILTAIITPMIIAPQGGSPQINWQNPQLIGACCAIISYFFTKKPLIIIFIGFTSFIAWKFLVLH